MNENIIENGMEFINDEKVIGKWEHFSIINSKEEFNPEMPTPLTDDAFKEIYFLENGQKYWIFEGWTKGFLLVHYGGNEPVLCYKYTIREEENNDFLFVESSDKQQIYVLKKTSDKHFHINEIGQRDNINLPFIADDRVLGRWKSICFVNNADDFDPNNSDNELWLKETNFYPNGRVVRIYSDESWEDKWTKGFVLDCKKSTASQYTFKLIDNIEYLLVEWKMGNYVYGGAKPGYYVFTR